MKNTSKKSFQMTGPLRSVRVHGGASGVKVALNGQSVVDVRNASPSPSSAATKGFSQSPDDDLSTIAIGRFIAEQPTQQQPAKSTDDEKEKEQGIVVGPITPIPAPKPVPALKPARLGL